MSSITYQRSTLKGLYVIFSIFTYNPFGIKEKLGLFFL